MIILSWLETHAALAAFTTLALLVQYIALAFLSMLFHLFLDRVVLDIRMLLPQRVRAILFDFLARV